MMIDRLPQNAIPGPDDITRVELDNGIVVLSRSNFHSPSVTISGYLSAGSLFDSEEKLGIADLTASALMRGTQDFGFHQIYDQLETVGASLNFSSGTHTTGFFGKSLVEDLPLIFDLFGRILQTPTFPEKEVGKLRGQMLTWLQIREQSTNDRAMLAFDEVVYQGHPYARPDEGYLHTVNQIQAADLLNFHQEHYGPRGMVIAVVGGIDPQTAVEQVQSSLGNWQNPSQSQIPVLPKWKPLTEKKYRRVIVSGMSQSDMMIGTAGPAREQLEYLAAALGNSILGQFGMMGRIGERLREESGLAYYAHSSLSGSLGPGPWTIAAGVNPDDESAAIDLILEEAQKFYSQVVSEEELADVKANFIGQMPLGLESNAGVAATLLHIEKHNLMYDYYMRFPERINSVTVADVLAAAQKYFDPTKFMVSVAGPPRE